MRRDMLILFALVLILILVFVLRPIAEKWHYVASAPAGELIYAAAFDGFEDEWEQAAGRNSAQIGDGVIQLEVGEPNDGLYAPALPYFTDFDLTVQAEAVSGPLDNAFGVVFRLQDPRNYYVFLISSDGYYSLERTLDGNKQVLSTWINSDAIHQDLNVVNTLRVVGVDEQFRFFINGQPVQLCIPDTGESTYRLGECIGGQMQDVLVDDSLDMGRVGMTVVTLSVPGVIVNFDDLIVYSPSENALNEEMKNRSLSKTA